jgi:alkanesulfonate monooxygenase SsuD/methylene tetrahydromethanopterin reductase-like flavin-dependent oxidoreductase (luciferase family)
VADYGHELSFGTFLTPSSQSPADVVRLAQLTEQVGLDLVTFQDHPYQPAFLDTWTLLSYAAARTSRVQLAANVLNLPLRPPAVLARSAASLDLLSGGRFELGIGAGGFWDAIEAMGGTRLAPAEAVDALGEAIEIIRQVWDAGTRGGVRLSGKRYRVAGAKRGPAPAHPIGIWVGAYKPRMLRLVGRAADGWLPSLGYIQPGELSVGNATIDKAAADAGRDPRSVRRLLNISGQFTTSARGLLTGPSATWAEQLAEFALADGVSTFILGTDDPDAIRTFAAEVVPAVRDLVAAARRAEAASGQAGQTAGLSSRGSLTGGAGPGNPGEGPGEDSRDSSTGLEGPGYPGRLRSAPDGSSAGPGTGRPGPSEPGQLQPAGAGEQDAATALGIQPTLDDGTRLSSRRLWDEASRPQAPAAPPGTRYTDFSRAVGGHLIQVHDMLREELATVRDLVAQVRDGRMDPARARSELSQLTIRQNNWTMGAYCQSYCRVVTGHHGLEDSAVFPHLRRSERGLAPVLDRLQEEHVLIHGVLDSVDRALVDFITDPARDAELQEAIDLLTDTLLSHLAYEERELVEPLARHGFYRGQL